MSCPHLDVSDYTCGLKKEYPFNGRCEGEERCPYNTEENEQDGI